VDEHHGRPLALVAVGHEVPAHAQPRVVETWTPAAGVRVHGRLGRPPGRSRGVVVMLHGLGVSLDSLAPLADRLARRRLVLALDLPGFGLSEAEGVWSTRRLADAVDEAIGLRGLGPATVLGHSYGCHVAAVLAARHPGRAGALVMLSPALDPRAGGMAGQVARLLVDTPMERPRLVAGATRDYLRAGPRRVIGTLREGLRVPLERVVAGVDAPVLIVRGSRDPLTTRRWARRMRRGAPRAWTAEIPRAAHALGRDAPGAVAACVEEFLERRISR
jgi:pimeloyl-ACP methyl ester carboxylesterase